MSDEKIVYRLYAFPLMPESIAYAQRQRFSRITEDYALVYMAADVPEGATEIAGDDLRRLSAEDGRWLADCNLVLLAEDAKRREREILDDMSGKIKRLETALEAERMKKEV